MLLKVIISTFTFYLQYICSLNYILSHPDFLTTGAKGTPYENGWYHGKIIFPPQVLSIKHFIKKSNLFSRISNSLVYFRFIFSIHINPPVCRCSHLVVDSKRTPGMKFCEFASSFTHSHSFLWYELGFASLCRIFIPSHGTRCGAFQLF
jgi:hypothetical protein